MVAIYFNMCGGLGPWVEYGCPHDRVACDEGAVRVDVFCWVPRRTVRADVGGVVRGYFHGYGRIWVLVGLSVDEVGRDL
jgi:hypothetical protein